MPDNALTPVTPVAPRGVYEAAGDSAALERATQLLAARAAQGAQEAKPAKPTEGATEPASRPETKPKPEKTSAAPAGLMDVRLQFKVDPDTHEITVLMIDKASHRVIRSIPAEELQKLNEGDLVELLA